MRAGTAYLEGGNCADMANGLCFWIGRVGTTQTACQRLHRKSKAGPTRTFSIFMPPASPGTYRLHFVASVSTANSATFGWTATWKDSNGNSQSPTNLLSSRVARLPPALTFTTAGNYYGTAVIGVDNSQTAIVFKFSFSGLFIAAKVSARVQTAVMSR